MSKAEGKRLCSDYHHGNYSKIFEAFFEHNLAQFALLDAEFNFIKVNRAYAKADNRDPSEFIGKNHFDLYPSEAEKIFKRVVATKQPYQVFARPFVYPYNPERGTTYWDWTLAPVLDANGEVDYLIFSLYNVTESVKAAVELDRFFNFSIDMLAIIDFKGKFTKVNTAFEKTLGYKEEELINKPAIELIHADDKLRSEQVFKHSISSGEPIIRFENRCCDSNQGYKWLEWVLVPDKVHDVTYAIARDITESKKIQQEMNRLESLSLLGTLTAEINHEVRNPMASVRGFLQLLLEQEDIQKYRKYFELMISELDRANSIITDYLSLASDKPLALEKKSLNKLVKKVAPLLKSFALDAGIALRYRLDDVPRILMDEKSIIQLILNLVRNGIEAMNQGGKLYIQTYLEEGQVVLAIKDEGCGIDPGIIEKLGTPFTTTKEKGTGLGLSICYRIVKKHNAKISLKTGSEGTTFYIHFKKVDQSQDENMN